MTHIKVDEHGTEKHYKNGKLVNVVIPYRLTKEETKRLENDEEYVNWKLKKLLKELEENEQAFFKQQK